MGGQNPDGTWGDLDYASCHMEVDREPQPSDGPEYHEDYAAWERRQNK